MLVFAAIVPCSPLLIPSVNPEHVHFAKETLTAYTRLAEELSATRPDTIVIFCDHPNSPTDAFAINVADPYHAGLSEFGDLGYSQSYGTDFMLADGMQRNVRHNGQDLTLETEKELPFTATVPLAFLTAHLPHVRILPIAPSAKTPKEHVAFGGALKESILSSTKRIAVIAAGDGSHTRSKDAPGGFHEEGEKMDNFIAEYIQNKNVEALLAIDETIKLNAKDESYRQVLMLLGLLESIPTTVQILSQEAPFGVGQLIAEFRLT